MAIKNAYVAGGCFWGVEYYFEKKNGVNSAVSGYMGGNTLNPDYNAICTGTTGHLEVVKVEFDDEIISYEDILKLFFEIHDFTQVNGQGPDIGSQYLSAIFYENKDEEEIGKELIKHLNSMGFKVATSLHELVPFYEAEAYHQDYYDRHQKVPYCHSYKKIF
jgi:methionine-S-sulfoxide reductase